MKKFLILIIIVSFAFIMQAKAQKTGSTGSTGSNYRTAVGAKIYFGDGTTGGINIKHFLNRTAALEGSLLFSTGVLGIEGLYEYHGDIAGAPGLKYYVGAGGIIAFSTDKYSSDDVAFGIKTTIGLDYKISGTPIDLAFDLDPTFTLAPVTSFDFGAGLAFRFAF